MSIGIFWLSMLCINIANRDFCLSFMEAAGNSAAFIKMLTDEVILWSPSRYWCTVREMRLMRCLSKFVSQSSLRQQIRLKTARTSRSVEIKETGQTLVHYWSRMLASGGKKFMTVQVKSKVFLNLKYKPSESEPFFFHPQGVITMFCLTKKHTTAGQ